VKIRELATIPLVLAPHPHGSRLVVEQTLKKFSIKPNIVLESDIWSVIKDAVQKDVAATLVPRRDVIEELRRGVLQATPLQKPGIRHTIALARLTAGRRASFEDELFGFLASRLQQALAIRENHAEAAPT
jgi:DNA-binding transcriptional LysR family regulator